MASALRRNREAETGERLAAPRVNWVWLVLLISAFAHVPIYVSSMAEMENASALRRKRLRGSVGKDVDVASAPKRRCAVHEKARVTAGHM